MRPFTTNLNLDDLLLDIATTIELSDNDRNVAASRYNMLKEHLERPSSPLKPYLSDNESQIYPQGSMAIGATIVSGTDDDRFDVDAIVEINVPSDWSPSDALDILEESLQGFPNVRKIERCTRCIQLQFAFMHMDVSILDPTQFRTVPRQGDIFHSPDAGTEYRVPSNPYGFSAWVRTSAELPENENKDFREMLDKRRAKYSIDRLSPDQKAAEQEKLPTSIPPRIDSPQIVALKLLKRYLNLKYVNRDLKKPPSVYLTKAAIDCGVTHEGLCAQLERLASYLQSEMEKSIQISDGPDERNPSYQEDRLNDRWPNLQIDRQVLKDDMTDLINNIEETKSASFEEIINLFTRLFGERVSRNAAKALMDRATSATRSTETRYEKKSGTILTSGALLSPGLSKNISTVQNHNFHISTLEYEKTHN